MTNVGLTSLTELLHLPPCDLPLSIRSDAIATVQPKKKKVRSRSAPEEDHGQSLAAIHTRLYLYSEIIPTREGLPDEVLNEIERERLLCRIALTYFRLRSADIAGLLADLRAIADDELLEGFDDETRRYVQSAVIRAALHADARHCAALMEIIDACNPGDATVDQVEPRHVVALADARASYDPSQAQAAISDLRRLAATSGRIGAAAHYLLAEIYGRLSLPLEQLGALEEWWLALTTAENKHPADVAGSLARENPAFEQALIRGAKDYARLLRANGKDERVREIATHFRAAGYTAVIDEPQGTQDRVSVECRLISPDTDADLARRWVYELLTRASAKEGCLIVRDTSEPERFPGQIDVTDEQFRQRVVGALEKSGIDVADGLLPVPFDSRRWILFRTATPFVSVAAGFLHHGTETSVVFWRSAIFDALTLAQKSTDWFEELTRVIRGQNDPQTVTAIREAIRESIAERRRASRQRRI